MEFQNALEEYERYFGENYCFYIGFLKTDEEIAAEIQKCIRTGKGNARQSTGMTLFIESDSVCSDGHVATTD